MNGSCRFSIAVIATRGLLFAVMATNLMKCEEVPASEALMTSRDSQVSSAGSSRGAGGMELTNVYVGQTLRAHNSD